MLVGDGDAASTGQVATSVTERDAEHRTMTCDTGHNAPIRPLPQDVASRIISSVVVTDVSSVVLGLLKNSLDARASSVDVTIDFKRGCCVVEDNGPGIPPEEFDENGNLGRAYYTSKYQSGSSNHGRHGLFLASVASMSLLTVTSRHHSQRLCNTLSWHYSNVVCRNLPSLAHQDLLHQGSGTRVVVRDLFGSMPVRVKQRAALEGKNDRLWTVLEHELLALLLAWPEAVTARIRDSVGGRQFKIGASEVSTSQLSNISTRFLSEDRSSSGFVRVLNILARRTSLPRGWQEGWVPIAASAPAVSIKGVISRRPAPSKSFQFISLGIHPLSADGDTTALFEQINRLFKFSSFGVEGANPVDGAHTTALEPDSAKVGNRSLTSVRNATKGIDRWPMFYLRIETEWKSKQQSAHPVELLSNEGNMQSLSHVLNAMISQWLSTHSYASWPVQGCPLSPPDRSRLTQELRSADFPVGTNESRESGSSHMNLSLAGQSLAQGTEAEYRRKTKRMRVADGHYIRSPLPSQDLQSRSISLPAWHTVSSRSKIRSGKSEFYRAIWERTSKPVFKNCSVSVEEQKTDEIAWSTGSKAWPSSASTNPESGPGVSTLLGQKQTQRASQLSNTPSDDPAANTTRMLAGCTTSRPDTCSSIYWRDAVGKKDFRLDSRTGMIIQPHIFESRSAPAKPNTRSQNTRSNRTVPHQAPGDAYRKIAKVKPKSWLFSFLHRWQNPTFLCVEEPIDRIINFAFRDVLNGRCERQGFADFHEHFSKDTSKTRLSKPSLRSCRIVGQVDKKFLLVKMRRDNKDHDSRWTEDDEMEMLVLIDQHAGDERIRVEQLLRYLCSSPQSSVSSYRSSLGHQSGVEATVLRPSITLHVSAREGALCIKHAEELALWGILYDVVQSKTKEDDFSVIVRTLPPVIAERCIMEPRVLEDLLRGEIWADLHSSSRLLRRKTSSRNMDESATCTTLALSTASEGAQSPDLWLNKLRTCPQALLGLLNSRACRSAVMFNDALDKRQCEHLVNKLGDCVFPFACAHGRPSMVPLVGAKWPSDCGSIGDSYLQPGLNGTVIGEDRDLGFVAVFGRWREKTHASGTDQ